MMASKEFYFLEVMVEKKIMYPMIPTGEFLTFVCPEIV
jgi:hypothetical protein